MLFWAFFGVCSSHLYHGCRGAQSLLHYVRVKRKKTTYFLEVEPSLTVLEVKQKLQEHCEQVGPPSHVPEFPVSRSC